MLLRIVSDLHTEFWTPANQLKALRILENVLPSLDTDKDSVLILAGDTGSIYYDRITYKTIMASLSERFKEILWIPGNHEYYNGCLVHAGNDYPEFLKQFPNVHCDFKTVIDGQTFLMATLWTSFNGADPNIMEGARLMMNDYRKINFNERLLLPSDILRYHEVDLYNLTHELHSAKASGIKPIVITHHAPSMYSRHPRYKDDTDMQHLYCNELWNLIMDTTPKLWFHGHVHHAFCYDIGDTRVISNPYGYHGRERIDYNRNLVLDIPTL